VDAGRVQAQVRRRVLAWLVRHDYMEAEAAATMLAWRHSGGFSVDASVAWRLGIARVWSAWRATARGRASAARA